jgi:hypothetical protein
MGSMLLYALTVAGAVAVQAGAQAMPRVDLAAARALVARVIPGSAARFEVAAVADSAGHDVFEVERHAGRVIPGGPGTEEGESHAESFVGSAERTPAMAAVIVSHRDRSPARRLRPAAVSA